jgi:hypothetical protein
MASPQASFDTSPSTRLRRITTAEAALSAVAPIDASFVLTSLIKAHGRVMAEVILERSLAIVRGINP